MTAYRDPKRLRYLLAWTSPLVPALAITLYFASGKRPALLLVPLAYVYVAIPVLDGWFGEDAHTPPASALASLERDPLYRTLLHVHIALLYASFVASAWFVGGQPLPLWAMAAFALGVGASSVDAIIVGHELGHKHLRRDRVAAQVALALVGYGHFRIEHNHGHHVLVATPEDSASARMGESVYRFALREIPGALRRGWALETQRLARHKRSAYCAANEILCSWTLTCTIGAICVAACGTRIVPFLILHHIQAWYGLTQANYVQHYGLLRQKCADGSYEPVAPHHSWNSNHRYSNLIMFNLQRHSDHHAHAARAYQCLRDIADLPRLPSGYPGCFGLAAIPRLWFGVMDAKLLAWAGHDLTRLNIDPKVRPALEARYRRCSEHERPPP